MMTSRVACVHSKIWTIFAGVWTNSNERVFNHRLRGYPTGSQRPIGSLPSAGTTARGPFDGLLRSDAFLPSGVSAGMGFFMSRLLFRPHQMPEKSFGSYAGFGAA